MVPHLTYPEALVVGLFQGVTELFPVSSLGHSVLIPALIGGSWAQDLNVSRANSPYLAFIVGLHVATAIAMIIYFWRDWLRIVGGFFTSIAHRRIETADQKLAWMIIFATIPVGIAGALLQHTVQDTFAKPVLTAIFLAINGLILFAGEGARRRQAAAPSGAGSSGAAPSGARSSGARSRPAPPRPLVEETWVASSSRRGHEGTPPCREDSPSRPGPTVVTGMPRQRETRQQGTRQQGTRQQGTRQRGTRPGPRSPGGTPRASARPGSRKSPRRSRPTPG